MSRFSFLSLFLLVVSAFSLKAVEPSGTLPIVYINTDENAPIVDKVTKIPAGLWVEIPEGCTDKDWALGSSENPVRLEIRGRGNSSWQADKKPYKIKFDKKTSILGMSKHKHFALLAHDGWSGTWAGYCSGFFMSELLGMPWTPASVPCELVLNGSYDGLYFLTESVKIDSNRIDIFEQEDLNEDPETIPYGWLVEIDNNVDEAQIVVKEGKDLKYDMLVTHKSPEKLSEAQSTWLKNNFSELCSLLQDTTEAKEKWVENIDPSTLARVFIIREMLKDGDGFNGSFYLYRDKEENARWTAGPIWDCSWYYNENPNCWTHENLPGFSRWKLIPDIITTNNFHEAFLKEWNAFYPAEFEKLKEKLITLVVKCAKAHAQSRIRWNQSPEPVDVSTGEWFYNKFAETAKWIDEHKGDVVSGIEGITKDQGDVEGRPQWFNLQGMPLYGSPTQPGIYIERNGQKSRKFMVR